MIAPPAALPTAAVLDDEPPARQRLVDLVAARPDVRLAGVWASGEEALAAMAGRHPDVLFVDVQMPGLDGFAVVERLAAGPAMPLVIFVTVHDRHALRAFEVSALDYLLEPFSDERFTRALDRALSLLVREERSAETERVRALLGEPAHGPAARLLVRDGGRIVFVDAAQIDFLEGAGVYVEIHAAGEALLHRETLAALERKLDPARFVRIHRSTIVNVERIKELRPHTHGEYIVVLRDGRQLKLSRSFRARIEALLRHGL